MNNVHERDSTCLFHQKNVTFIYLYTLQLQRTYVSRGFTSTTTNIVQNILSYSTIHAQLGNITNNVLFSCTYQRQLRFLSQNMAQFSILFKCRFQFSSLNSCKQEILCQVLKFSLRNAIFYKRKIRNKNGFLKKFVCEYSKYIKNRKMAVKNSNYINCVFRCLPEIATIFSLGQNRSKRKYHLLNFFFLASLLRFYHEYRGFHQILAFLNLLKSCFFFLR